MYEVKPGDYCYKIAISNGISYQQFLAQNPGINCANLYVNQKVCLLPITLPGWSGYKAQPVSCRTYQVQPGDVCSAIAEQSSMSVDRLVELNANMVGWNGCQELYIGQTLCLD
ncbi:hypothetical protein EC988_002535 [Linderina pennispora]|nr:hypothetical protein EC988_002535 [Linderina pennispora]